MVDARQSDCWQHTSYLLAAILTAACQGKKIFQPNDLNPYRAAREPAQQAGLVRADEAALFAAFGLARLPTETAN